MTLELETGDIDLDHSALITANGSKTVSLQLAILWIAARLGSLHKIDPTSASSASGVSFSELSPRH